MQKCSAFELRGMEAARRGPADPTTAVLLVSSVHPCREGLLPPQPFPSFPRALSACVAASIAASKATRCRADAWTNPYLPHAATKDCSAVQQQLAYVLLPSAAQLCGKGFDAAVLLLLLQAGRDSEASDLEARLHDAVEKYERSGGIELPEGFE